MLGVVEVTARITRIKQGPYRILGSQNLESQESHENPDYRNPEYSGGVVDCGNPGYRNPENPQTVEDCGAFGYWSSGNSGGPVDCGAFDCRSVWNPVLVDCGVFDVDCGVFDCARSWKSVVLVDLASAEPRGLWMLGALSREPHVGAFSLSTFKTLSAAPTARADQTWEISMKREHWHLSKCMSCCSSCSLWFVAWHALPGHVMPSRIM